jgi:hypothetical protein
MSYTDIVIRTGSLLFLETWPPIYRGQERTVRDRLKSKPSLRLRLLSIHTLFDWFHLRVHPTPYSPILSPSYWTFVELTLVIGRPFFLQNEGVHKKTEASRPPRAKQAFVARLAREVAPPLLIWASWLPSCATTSPGASRDKILTM